MPCGVPGSSCPPSLRTNPPPTHRGLLGLMAMFVQNDLIPLAMVGLTWIWQLTKAGPITFIPWEFGIKKYNIFLLRAWPGWTQKLVQGVAILCLRHREAQETCLLREKNEVAEWWEAGRRRERAWEYVHFFTMTILCLILFLQCLKPSPHLPAFPWYNLSIFIPTNKFTNTLLLPSYFFSYSLPLVDYIFYYSQYVWTYFILIFKNSKTKITVLSLSICSSKSLILSQQHFFLKTFSIAFDFNITLVSGAQHNGLTFI